ncbi:acetyl-CoA C-acyltransferase [Pseudoclavibacter endophyticus]|uniref:Probable acetyl-CoA acetyltransferase n=1 Tax=Pseudoclavibacter endophyticus TaxID=1778590 RepID=A0A6H9WS98_9MICO|nr:acetyl-CoA C-acyltransferase [Pseudoclavibacter endophyticus]KAB1649585.1 acetyl-CoA C-acyltransferase [Pseudoclavibacter endophyticus]
MSIVIAGGARTPIGKLLGALRPLTAAELGRHAIEAALARSGVTAADVDLVYLGNVIQAGVGPSVARLSSIAAGVPMTAVATTINKQCLSGLAAIRLAALELGAGDAEVAIAGGTESMTNAPHLAHVRGGIAYGSAEFADALERDGLVCGIEREVMGAATERHQRGLGLSRAEQDEVALRSHARAARAHDGGRFADEIVPIDVPGRRGAVVVDRDEGVRPDTTSESLARLRPAFAADGDITAGNASQLSDGAAAVVVTTAEQAARRGVTPLAEVVATGTVAGPDASLLHQPARAIARACERAGIAPAELDLVEINEAFASVAIASTRELAIDPERVNVNGGAIALGHPVGMSGTRVALTLAHELRRRGGGIGAAALCGGGGQGEAIILRVG